MNIPGKSNLSPHMIINFPTPFNCLKAPLSWSLSSRVNSPVTRHIVPSARIPTTGFSLFCLKLTSRTERWRGQCTSEEASSHETSSATTDREEKRRGALSNFKSHNLPWKPLLNIPLDRSAKFIAWQIWIQMSMQMRIHYSYKVFVLKLNVTWFLWLLRECRLQDSKIWWKEEN